MSVFSTDSVTIVRKKGGSFTKEEISTAIVLPGCSIGQDRNRSGVIARLRKDPSVVFVFEEKDGRTDEKVSLSDGFEMAISLVNGDEPRASIAVYHDNEKVFEDEFEGNPVEGEFESIADNLLEEAMEILDSIERKDYSFVSEDCNHFTLSEAGEEVDLFRAMKIMEEEGFQTETIHTIGYLSNPFLFIYENEVILLGSHCFDGKTLYLEMKRLFIGVDQNVVRKAVERAQREFPLVEVIEREDGSWSFRGVMDEDVDTENFIEKLTSDIAILREAIAIVEGEDEIGEEVFPIMCEQRQLFIFETIDSSMKLKNLNI